MKCEDAACIREAKIKKAMKWYCSDFCAQVDSEWALKSTPFPTGSSSTAEPIEAWGQSKNEGPQSVIDMSDTRSADEMQKKKHIGKTQKSEAKETQSDTETRELAIQNPSAIETMQTDSALTRLVPSVERVTSLDGETLDAMSLIDDSVRHMHGLTKSVVDNVKERA